MENFYLNNKKKDTPIEEGKEFVHIPQKGDIEAT